MTARFFLETHVGLQTEMSEVCRIASPKMLLPNSYAAMMLSPLGGIMKTKMTHAMRMEFADVVRARCAAAANRDSFQAATHASSAIGFSATSFAGAKLLARGVVIGPKTYRRLSEKPRSRGLDIFKGHWEEMVRCLDEGPDQRQHDMRRLKRFRSNGEK